MGKRMILRRLSQDGDGVRILSCEIHLPVMRGAGTTPTDSILYRYNFSCNFEPNRPGK